MLFRSNDTATTEIYTVPYTLSLHDALPIALTLGLIAWIESPETSGFDELVLLVVRQLALGLLIGVVLALAATWVFARLPRAVGPFSPVASLAAAGIPKP